MSFTLARKAATVLLVPLFALLATGRTLAQVTTGTTTSTATGSVGALSKSDFNFFTEYYDPNQGIWVQMNTTQQAYFFNRARCECVGDTGDGSNYRGYFKIAIQPAATTGAKIQALLTQSGVQLGDGRFYAGANAINCLSVASYTGSLAGSCTNLENPTLAGYTDSFPLTDFETKRIVESKPIAVSTLFGSLSGCGASNSCDSVAPCSTTGFQTQTIYFWARTGGTQTPDTADMSFSLNLNGELQYRPAGVTAQGGNDALIVNWAWPPGITPSGDASFFGVQIFCQRAGSYQVFPDGSYGAGFMQSAALCGAAAPVLPSAGAFSNLSPRFLCSGLLPSTASSYRITGLQNDIWYGVGVAAVDKYGNVSDIDPEFGVAYGKPVPTVDFYSEYRDSGGNAQGGFCSLAGWKGRPGTVGLALVALGLLALLLIARRSRKGRTGTTLLVLLVAGGALLARPAHADDASDSDEDEPEPPVPEEVAEVPALPPAWTGTDRNFALEIRFGLYMPNVDSELGSTGTQPNTLIFGTTKRAMWQVEFDWEILQKFGALSLGASVGYWKENGQACLLSDLKASGQCTASGDSTSLRLIPFALLLVYRMDEAAIRWRIPLVPYAKVGLNYTIWTVNNGDGNVPDYAKGGHGQGGTAGWQAAAGLALQLDFIDPAAAHEFDADVGVNHTYAFFELDHIDGSGLYRSNALRVGDNTWFAGLMFEF